MRGECNGETDDDQIPCCLLIRLLPGRMGRVPEFSLDCLPCTSEVDAVARLNVGFVAFLIDVNRMDRPAL
jgi:hypothetical protein